MVPSVKQTRRSDAWITYSRVAQVRMSVIVPSPKSDYAMHGQRFVMVALSGVLGDPSLNDLVRPLQQRRRDRQPERLGGLEVDHQLELRRLLNGEVARFGALQDLVDEDRRAPLEIGRIRIIGHQATGIDHAPGRVQPRY